MNNILYQTVFNKPVKEIKTRTEEQDGKQVTITEEVDSTVPVKLIINTPTRKQREEASELYAIEQSRLISNGVLTREMLRKRILDVNGSFLTKDETKAYADIIKRRQEIHIDYQRINMIKDEDRTKEEKELFERLPLEWQEIEKQLQNLEQLQESLFNQCAETLASNKILTWYMTHLPQIEENGKVRPLFEGETFEERLDAYDKIIEQNNPFLNEVLTRSGLVITMWRNQVANNQGEFDEFIKKITAE